MESLQYLLDIVRAKNSKDPVGSHIPLTLYELEKLIIEAQELKKSLTPKK